MEGKVKFFSKAKGFGFIQGDDGEDYFFHIRAYRIFDVSNDKPVFIDAKPEKIPEEGNDVVFIRARGEKGLQASPWTYAAALDRAPKVKSFGAGAKLRVVRIRTARVDGQTVEKTLWKGDRLQSLALKRPRTGNSLTDSLVPELHPDFDEIVLFEVNLGKGWQECEDPRPFDS